jgi:hypothetical protein
MKSLTSGSASLLAAWVLLASAGASADVTKDECVDANARAQPLRRAGKLRAAREQLETCMDRSCPRIVRDDCMQRLGELERAQPTVVFEAKDAAGHEVGHVRVSMDGRPLADRFDGTALEVDPGEHEFTFEVAGQPPVIRRFVLRESDKARRIPVMVGVVTRSAADVSVRPPPDAARSNEVLPEPPPARVDDRGGRGRTSLAIALGGVGIAMIVVGSVSGLLTSSSWNSSKRACSSSANCLHHDQAVSDHDTAVTEGAISTIGFIAGGAFLAGGIALWLTAPSETGVAAGGAIRIGPSIGVKTAGVAVSGEF